MGVTIKDVAKKTGLSITTVSLVLNKKQSRIPEKTRQIVESAAQELNYSPSHAAISLATKRTATIALVLPEDNHYQPADLLIPTEHACRNAGYSLLVKLVENDDESTLESINTLLQRGVDGIVFDPSKLQTASVGKYMDLLEKSATPVISLAGVGAHILPNSIVSDHRRGGYLATRHLVEFGHKKIGCLAGSDDSPVCRDIRHGYRDALEEAGIGDEFNYEFSGAYTAAKGEEGMGELCARGVTAVVAGSLPLARGVYRHAHRAGLSIPGDLSVVGYGDGEAAGDMVVPLTTVSLHFDRFARKTVALIKQLADKKNSITPEVLPPSLVPRESAGPANR